MTIKADLRIIRRHPAAVVGNADGFEAAILNEDVDPGCPGVE